MGLLLRPYLVELPACFGRDEHRRAVPVELADLVEDVHCEYHPYASFSEQRAAARRGVRGETGGEASGLVLPSSLATPGVSCGNAS